MNDDISQLLDRVSDGFAGMNRDDIQRFLSEAKQRAKTAIREQSEREKKRQTRRYILDGKLLSYMVQRGVISDDDVREMRAEYLAKNDDRALFDLPPIEQQPEAKKRRGRPKKTEAVAAAESESSPAAPAPTAEILEAGKKGWFGLG